MNPTMVTGLNASLLQHFLGRVAEIVDQDGPAIAQDAADVEPALAASAGGRGLAVLNMPIAAFAVLAPDLKPGRLAQMLVDQHSLQGRDRDIGANGFFRFGQLGAGAEAAAHLVGAVVVEQADRIGPAAGAVAHLRQELLGLVAECVHLLLGRLGNILKGGVGIGEHGHAVEQIHAQLLHGRGQHRDVVIVDPRNDDGVDLDRDAVLLQQRDRLQLAGEQQFRPLAAAVEHLAVPHPGVDVLARSPDRPR